MNTFCNFYLRENRFMDFYFLDVFCHYNKANHNERLVHYDQNHTSLIHELRNDLIEDLYGIFQDINFHINEECFNFKTLFTEILVSSRDRDYNKDFFNDNLHRFNCEV